MCNIGIKPFLTVDIDTVYKIQKQAYKSLYDTYYDDDTNPYMENKDTVIYKYTRQGTIGYLITLGDTVVVLFVLQFNCHLYEKLGFVRTGKLQDINDRMTIVYYEKNMRK